MNRKVRTSGVLVAGVLAAGTVLLSGGAVAVASPDDATGNPPAVHTGGLDDAQPLGVPVAGTVRAVVDGVTKLVGQ